MSPRRGFASNERKNRASTIVATPMIIEPTPRTTVSAR
jgi:hypothetical protein